MGSRVNVATAGRGRAWRGQLLVVTAVTAAAALLAGCTVTGVAARAPRASATPTVPPSAAAVSAPAPSPVSSATAVQPDVFRTGLDTGREGESGLWLSWSLVDRSDGRPTGSANSMKERTNAESSMKAWIAADRLRVDSDARRATSAHNRALIDRAIRASDDAAAEELYRGLGADTVLRQLNQVCGVAVTTSKRGYWSYAQITAENATKVLDCVLDKAPTYRDGKLLIDALHGVNPDGRFGIPQALPPGTDVAVKNGWTAHSATGQWNLNCVASWDHYTLAVLTRYPIGRGQDYGAGVCRDVTTKVLAAL
jgi:hypothetical protein